MAVIHRAFLLAALAAVALAGPRAQAASPLIVAVPDIGFSDSSGEAKNQEADHRQRLHALVDGLRADIAKDGHVASLALSCGTLPCRLDGDEVGRLRSQARDAGASFIVLCGVHKMSTLVMAMKVDVFEVGSGRLVTSKLLSFRGDNDEGWRRAGVFVAQEVAEAIAKPRVEEK
jgi:hypothetical protein